MATVSASKFKAQCLALMDRVAEKRESYVITKHGRPVAKLVPADPPARSSVFGCLADRMEVVGDLDATTWSEARWKDLEREQAAQREAWEREWRARGTISGKLGSGRPVPPGGSLAGRLSRPRKAGR
jgi:prevent-host-death family protein